MKKVWSKLLAVAVAAAMICPALPAFAAEETITVTGEVKEIGEEEFAPVAEEAIKADAASEEGMLQISASTLLKLQLKLTAEGDAAKENTEMSFITTQNASDVSADTTKIQYIDQKVTGEDGTITVQFRPRGSDPVGIYNMRAAAVGGGALSKFYKTMEDQVQPVLTDPSPTAQGENVQLTISGYTLAWEEANTLYQIKDNSDPVELIKDTDYSIASDQSITTLSIPASGKFAEVGTYQLRFVPTAVGGAYNPISFSIEVTEKTYSLTLDGKGGSVVTVDPFKASTIPEEGIAIPASSRTGYTFGGWWTTEAEGGTKIESITQENLSTVFPTGKTATLYARWSLVDYTITYNNLEGAANSNPTTYNIESEDITLADLSGRTGYTFDGWYTDASLEPSSKVSGVAISKGSTGNKIFYAKWTAATNTITSSFASVNPGVSIPDGLGGSFEELGGTAATGSTVTFDVTAPKGYTLTAVKYNDGTDHDLTKDPDGGKYSFTMPAANVVVTATVTPITYTISFDVETNGGTASAPAAVTGTVEALPKLSNVADPVKTGNFTFAGWYTTAATPLEGKDVQVTKDEIATTARLFELVGDATTLTLYARWNSYELFTVSYVAGGDGVQNMPTDETSYRKDQANTITIPATEPTRAGYTFTGWKVAGDDVTLYKTGTEHASYAAAANSVTEGTLNFTAQWTANSYSITLSKNDGTETPATMTIGGTVESFTGLDDENVTAFAALNGYQFDGWYTAATAGDKIDAITADNLITLGGTTLYAHWTEIVVTEISLAPSSAEIKAAGGTVTFVPTITPATALNQELVWTIVNDDESVSIADGVFTVDSSVQNLTQTYTVKAENAKSGVSATATVKVDIYTGSGYSINSVNAAANTVNVTKNTGETAWVVVALYKRGATADDITLVKATVKDITGLVNAENRTQDVELTDAFAGEYTFAKVFMWNDLNVATPHCASLDYTPES